MLGLNGRNYMVEEITMSEAEFDRHLSQPQEPLLLFLWGKNCGISKKMEPLYDTCAIQNNGKAFFWKMNVNDHYWLVKKFRIQGTPTLIAFKEGKEIGRTLGYLEANALKEQVDHWLAK